jgi:sortase A
MPIYTYVKKKTNKLKTVVKIVSLIFIIMGLAMITWVLYPIVSFNILYAGKFGELLSPIPNKISKKNLRQEFPNIFISSNDDYTRANSWFPSAISVKPEINNLNDYFLSIPKLGIEKANVSRISDDLSRNLVHFTGPLPGQNGNIVIFGHSTLTWLYDIKNYKTIFTRLPDLSKGDYLSVSADNITYNYKIFEMKIVDPSNLSPLDQTNDDSYLTLITCVPPGTYFKRLIIKSRLTNS